MSFPRNSAFHDSYRAQGPAPTDQEIRDAIAKVTEVSDRKEIRAAVNDIPLDHWHHDLETIRILLHQDPPDVERARRLAEDIGQEIYREMR